MTTPAELEGSHQRHFGWFEDLVMDLRYSFRSLRQRGNRGFAAVAILTLALGIGAATSIFSVAYGFLNDAFPFANVDGIWQPWINFPPQPTANQTRVPRNFATELPKLAGIAEVMESTIVQGGPTALFVEGPYQLDPYITYQISPNGFAFLGVPPLMGRTINASDLGENGAPADVVVLSYAGWKKFFPDDANPIGKTVEFKNAQGQAKSKKVIGIMPERFGSQPLYDIGNTAWTPLPGPGFDAAAGTMQVRPRVRLKPGVSKEVAQQQVHQLYSELAKAAPQNSVFYLSDASGARTPRQINVTLRDFVSSTFDPQGVVKDNIKYLSVAVGLLLLIACMNVANLQLARAAARSREIAVRLAMGAGRKRLMRQLITESVVLALIGAAVGILVAYGFTKGALAMMPPNTFGTPLPESAKIGINGMVLLFAVIIAIISGVLFGLAPAIQSTRPDLNDALKDGSRGSAGVYGSTTRAVLVVAEVAFSIILLVVASVTLWGYVRMTQVDPGFNPDRFYLMAPNMAATDPRAIQFLERTRSMPFVESASRAFIGGQSKYTIEGKPRDETKSILTGLVDEGFLKVAGVRLIRGRNFEEAEVTRGDPVALVGDATAELWPKGEDPIGKHITVDAWAPAAPPAPRGSPPNPPGIPPVLTVIGVVSNLRPNVSQDPIPSVFTPYTVRPGGGMFGVRVKQGDIPAVQTEMQKMSVQVDKTVRINVQDMAAGFDQQFALPRFNFVLFCSLAVIALMLAVAGIYSVLSYHITQKTREFGVRLALGADRSNILALVLRTGGRLLGIGLVVGIGGSLATSKVLESQTTIFRVNFSDPTTLGLAFGAIALLTAAATAACLVPARRATKVDPLTALRAE